MAALAAGLAAAVVSVPLALAALTAARTFGRAAARYRLVGIAFALCAATAPLGYWLARGLAHVAVRAALPLAGIPPASGPLPLVGAALIAGGAAVAAILLLLLARDVVRLRRVKRRAVPLGLGGPRGATVATSADVVTPTAIGYLHPAIVVPAGFRARVDAGEWEAVLAHERAHLARRDDWAKALQSACSRAGWWIPGLWLLGRALDLERELASDERAAGETGPRRYAACLLRLATQRCDDALAPALWGRRSHVAIRVERLMRPRPAGTPVVRAAALGAFTAVACACLALAVVSIPLAPPARPAAQAAGQLARAGAPLVVRDTRTPRDEAHPARRLAKTPSPSPSDAAATAVRPAPRALAAARRPHRAAAHVASPPAPSAVSIARTPRRPAAVSHRARAPQPVPAARIADAAAPSGPTSAPSSQPASHAAGAARAASDDRRAGGAPSPLPGAPAAEAIAPPDPSGGGAGGLIWIPIPWSPPL
ncbi:MAG TPA: M56 family metallopeptidase [Candidatus Baltobacteraceae bacterium]|nr:M56 family metallopeptidase [Candidatus Baltobacteraceae bacterium]